MPFITHSSAGALAQKKPIVKKRVESADNFMDFKKGFGLFWSGGGPLEEENSQHILRCLSHTDLWLEK